MLSSSFSISFSWRGLVRCEESLPLFSYSPGKAHLGTIAVYKGQRRLAYILYNNPLSCCCFSYRALSSKESYFSHRVCIHHSICSRGREKWSSSSSAKLLRTCLCRITEYTENIVQKTGEKIHWYLCDTGSAHWGYGCSFFETNGAMKMNNEMNFDMTQYFWQAQQYLL